MHSSQSHLTYAQCARLSVAPMMAWTDRHCRYFHRLMSRHTLLYTEMVTAAALVHGGAVHLLDHDPAEHPVAVQLGGSEPDLLRPATQMAVDAGYREVNLNVGCPSDRVQSGAFGAVLMTQPDTVRDCLIAMQKVPGAEVTVKCRIGVDDQTPAMVLPAFLDMVEQTGVRRVIIHARKAWLQGLSPKENREIPPLDYPLVHQMAAAFPGLHISLNGGIADLQTGMAALEDANLQGIMIGRAVYHNPADILLTADTDIYGDASAFDDPVDVAHAMEPYIANHLQSGGRLHQITRHMLGLFAGGAGARHWRRMLSDLGANHDATVEDYRRVVTHVAQMRAQAAEHTQARKVI